MDEQKSDKLDSAAIKSALRKVSDIRKLSEEEVATFLEKERTNKFFRVSKHNYARRLRFWAKMRKKDRV